jgi:hypothetical protein
LLSTGGARTGIAPVNLLEVQTLAGDIYCWSDRPVSVPSVILSALASGSMFPSPPFPIPEGQGVVWALPKAVSSQTAGDGTAGSTLTVQQKSGHDLQAAWVWWLDFELPSGCVIPETEIVGIFPVLVGEQSNYEDMFLQCDRGLNPLGSGGFVNLHNWYANGMDMPSSPEFVSSAGSIGTSLTDLVGMGIGVSLACQNDQTRYTSYLSISAVGFAIYYRIPGAGGSSGAPVAWSSLTGPVRHAPWLLSVPQISFHRSLQTDTGSFVVQNLSGDTLSRDVEKQLRASAFEGALFVYRLWQADAEAAWIEVHGTLSVDDVGVDTITFKGAQLLNPSQDDTPLENYCETCQLDWGGIRCGASGSTECSYSYQTCQVIERIMVVMNDYEKNYGETLANTALNVTNRRRLI